MKKNVLLALMLVLTLLSACSAPKDDGELNSPTPDPAEINTTDPTGDPSTDPSPDDSPLPSSEHVTGDESMVTQTADTLEKIVITYDDKTTELTGDDAKELFDALLNIEAITVADPYHYEVFTTASIYSIDVHYTDGEIDTILTGSEQESTMNFYRTLPDMGDNGDNGFVFFKDEDDALLDMLKGYIEQK